MSCLSYQVINGEKLTSTSGFDDAACRQYKSIFCIAFWGESNHFRSIHHTGTDGKSFHLQNRKLISRVSWLFRGPGKFLFKKKTIFSVSGYIYFDTRKISILKATAAANESSCHKWYDEYS
jgi:hypothetical protein